MKTLVTILIAAFVTTPGFAQKKSVAKHTAKSVNAGMTYWNISRAKWTDNSGLHEAVVSGDLSKPGSVIYLKADSGAKVPWHWHTGPEIVYGDSGNFEVGMLKSGEKINITSGSYARMPGHMIHNATCISKDPCTLYIESPQAFDYHEVDENGKEIKPAAKPAK